MNVRNGKQAMKRRQETALVNRKKNLSVYKSTGETDKALKAQAEVAILEKSLGL